MYSLLILSLFLATCECFKILCLLPYPGKSHQMVFDPLLQELTERGHHLTVVSFFPPSIPKPNRRDVSLVDFAPLNVEVIDLDDVDYTFFGLERYFEHIPIVTQIAKANLRLCEKLLNSKVFEEFVQGRGNYDLILVEHFNSDCMLGLVHIYGVPSVGLMSCAMLPWTPSRVGAPDNPSYVPGMTLPFTEEMTLFEKLENAIMLYFYEIWYEVAIRREEQRIWEKKLGRKVPLLGEVGKNASAVLVNTHYSWNGVRVVPPSIVEVGGIHLHNRTVQPLPQYLEKWVSGAKEGFILFSFGSLIRGSSLPKKRLSAILKVFARLPQRVVWKWEAEDIEDLPGNVLVIKWLPQYDLLNHPNCVAFITHAGMLSLTEAVSAGVPTLASPVLGDQFSNAAHAHRAGVAQVLRLRDITEDSLYDVLQKVLSLEMRDRAKSLSKIWHDRPQMPIDTAVYFVELAARHKGLELSSYARRLNRLQIAFLDVLAFVLALVVIPVMVIKCLCKKSKVKQC